MNVRILLAGLDTSTARDKLLQLEQFLRQLREEPCVEVLHRGCEEHLPLIQSWAAAHPQADPGTLPDLTLVCATESGKRLGMAQAAAAGQDCHTEALGLRYEKECLMVCRKVYSTHLTALFPATETLLVLADTASKADALPIGELPVSIGQWKVPEAPGIVTQTIPLEIPRDLSREKLVLLGGKGLGSKENFQRLEALAQKLGAGCACTRPVALSGWTDFGKVTGVSGWQLNAKVCIAFGVSGAAPPLYGLEPVARVIAINND
jgi:electron transfer flavoprotein alpha subunit